jgi:hypothetical protein
MVDGGMVRCGEVEWLCRKFDIGMVQRDEGSTAYDVSGRNSRHGQAVVSSEVEGSNE